METTGDDNTNQKKRKSNWTTFYSNMTQLQANGRLGIRMGSLASSAIPASELLASLGYRPEEDGLDVNTMETREKVFDHMSEKTRTWLSWTLRPHF